jgi:hypothetical protein
MDEPMTKNESRDTVLTFFVRVDDLRKQIVEVMDELNILRRDGLSHYSAEAQEELRKAFSLLWESQNNLTHAATHTVTAHNVHYRTD